MDERCFQAKEHTLDKDLHKGKADHAAALLLDEFQSDPSQALALVKSEMSRQSQGSNRDKLHINVENNGDVVIWDRGEKNGRYAGNVPEDMRAQFTQKQAKAEAPAAVRADERTPQMRAEARYQSPGPQSYEYSQPRRKGFHIPCPIEFGVKDGSVRLGLNIFGLAKGGVMLGAKTRAYAGSDALNTVASAGVDFNKNHIGPAAGWRVLGDSVTSGSAKVGITPNADGINIGGGADAHVFGKTVGAGGHGGLEIGNKFGPKADAYTHVGEAKVGANAYANLSEQGIQAGGDTDIGAQPYAGVHAQARAGLGAVNEARADVGTNIGDNGISAGAGLYPQVHPDVYVKAYSGDRSAGVGLNPGRAWWQKTNNDDIP